MMLFAMIGYNIFSNGPMQPVRAGPEPPIRPLQQPNKRRGEPPFALGDLREGQDHVGA